MNPFYAEYIATAKRLTEERGLSWNLVFDGDGKVSKDTRWNLTELRGGLSKPVAWLGQVGVDTAPFEKLNDIRVEMGQGLLLPKPMSPHWLDFFQAVLIHQLLLAQTKPGSAVQVGAGIRRLAPAAEDTPPWAVTPDQIQQAYNAVLRSSESGKQALDFVTMVRNVIDKQKLADTPALARFCQPYASKEALTAQQRADAVKDRQNAHGGRKSLRRSLAERKSASKLPDEKAFWELVRIVFTETPLSFSDAIRFAAFKVQIIMGFRIGEAALLPLDWKRWREYLDADGRPAGEHGGFSRSLIIRYFAEKQEEDDLAEGLALYENIQHVPPMFEEILVETLDHIATITAPLRKRLKRQAETGRIFPEYAEDALVPAWEMYVRMTGNAVFSDAEVPPELIRQYRESYDPQYLDTIRDLQLDGRPAGLSQFWTNPAQRTIPIRTSAGVIESGRINWRSAFVRIGDVEEHIRENRGTKLSATKPTATTDGTVFYPHDLLFLMPIRNLIEGRNNGLLDTTLYSAIGILDKGPLNGSLSGKASGETLFQRYGQTDEDCALTLTSHSLRHLQNTELFRLGVADTMITKKFGRRSVQQSYEYDHRSLHEDIEHIDVPPEAEDSLGDKALQVYKMIAANKVRGPIVDEFRRVQREYGDDAAFDYLNAEADGLHVTPYGLCVNSFTSDPCPKHLECFNGCLHLARTDVVEEHDQLEKMRDRFAKIIIQLESVPEGRRYAGWANQIAHARIRYENIGKALATEPGERPFPDGTDLSVTPEQKFGNTIIDTMNRLRDLDD
ncbi:hypothetical protein [Rhizobium mesoamericanum]|uniref:Integrase n=1 Tax=Rhizobium mesoamericanum STM3625 TaxID=1211777 RepID=K0PSW8_9HYPH|nr:hypothetical protein [Rhizobium mesoamericanum]CCM79836.1 conserved hypothetical protein [Rhizobium mesoamericanum STM3625]